MTKFDELKQRYPNLIPVQELRSNISIVELALQHGYEFQHKKGANRPVLEHPNFKDTIIIKNPKDASQQVYQRAGDFTDSGTIIDFVRNRLSTVFSQFNHPGEHEFKNITSVLYDYLRIDPNHVNQNRKATASLVADPASKQPFAKEQFDLRALEDNNYLTKRHIAPETINRPEFAGKVFAQIAYLNPATGHTESFLTAKEHPERNYIKYTNVGFPYYNGQSSDITGIELRNESIKLHAPGSDRFSSVFVSNPPAVVEKFFIMESAIDALSHQQLRSIKGDTKFDSIYFSTGGQLTPQQVNTMTRYMGSFAKPDNYTINLAFDNDAKGARYDLQFIQQLAATRFPMSATVGSGNRISYLLPEEAAYRPIRDELLDRVDWFNKNVQAQFVRSDTDVLGQKELISQQIIIASVGQKYALNIPESCPALSMINKAVLDMTGLDKQIIITKAQSKDFNEDLTREVSHNKKFRFSLDDETGQTIYNSNNATVVARTLNHLRHQGESEGSTKTYLVQERQAYGFKRPQAELKVVEGKVVSMTQQPEFQQQLLAEKAQRNQVNQTASLVEKKVLNPEIKPQSGQTPEQPENSPTNSRRR